LGAVCLTLNLSLCHSCLCLGNLILGALNCRLCLGECWCRLSLGLRHLGLSCLCFTLELLHKGHLFGKTYLGLLLGCLCLANCRLLCHSCQLCHSCLRLAICRCLSRLHVLLGSLETALSLDRLSLGRLILPLCLRKLRHRLRGHRLHLRLGLNLSCLSTGQRGLRRLHLPLRCTGRLLGFRLASRRLRHLC